MTTTGFNVEFSATVWSPDRLARSLMIQIIQHSRHDESLMFYARARIQSSSLTSRVIREIQWKKASLMDDASSPRGVHKFFNFSSVDSAIFVIYFMLF